MARAQAVGAGVAAADDDDALAGRKNVERGIERVAVAALVLLRQKFHGVVNALQFAAGNLQDRGDARTPPARTMASKSRRRSSTANVRADFGIGDELHALGGHLFEAAVDDVLLQLEFGNAVAQQSADAVRLSRRP